MIKLAAQLAKRIAATCTILAIVTPTLAQPIPQQACSNPHCFCTACTCGPSCTCCQSKESEQNNPQTLPQKPPTPNFQEPTKQLSKPKHYKELPTKNHNPRGPPHS
ncbi:MAG: hypothetical protein ACKVQS_13690 [Fimbriimonadaceae bacterium]